MKAYKSRLVIVGLVLVILILAAALVVQSQGDYSGTIWEYLYVRPVEVSDDFYRPAITDLIMNGEAIDYEGQIYEFLGSVGLNGWELVDVIDGAFVFKRPKE